MKNDKHVDTLTRKPAACEALITFAAPIDLTLLHAEMATFARGVAACEFASNPCHVVTDDPKCDGGGFRVCGKVHADGYDFCFVCSFDENGRYRWIARCEPEHRPGFLPAG